MSADTKTSKLYDAAIDEVTGNGRAWKSICRLTGQQIGRASCRERV